MAQGTTTTKQTSRRWAAMRLLQELNFTIDPAFFRDTPEGMWLLHTLTNYNTAYLVVSTAVSLLCQRHQGQQLRGHIGIQHNFVVSQPGQLL